MYLQGHLNFIRTFDSDMKFSLDFWQKHIKIIIFSFISKHKNVLNSQLCEQSNVLFILFFIDESFDIFYFYGLI